MTGARLNEPNIGYSECFQLSSLRDTYLSVIFGPCRRKGLERIDRILSPVISWNNDSACDATPQCTKDSKTPWMIIMRLVR